MQNTHPLAVGVANARDGIASSDVVRERFGDADGLRAFAILAVVFFEAIQVAAPQRLLIHPALARLASDASQGLTLFFVLSGFTLAYPALKATRQDGRAFLDIGRYAVKRILRIYPAYLALLGLTLILPDLAQRYGLPGLAVGAGPFPTHAFVQNALFAGDGLGNDGFRSLAIVARWYLLFPFLLLLWTRGPWIFAGVGALATIVDLTTPAHGYYLGALAPFMLGIVAAEIRVQHHRFERFGLLLALGMAAVALLLEPFERLLPGPQSSPDALRIDPLWAVALFGVVAGAGAFRLVERALSLMVLRILGAASFAISLIVLPVTNFAVRQSQSAFGPLWRAANAGALALVVGYVLWQVVDRWFADGPLRRDVAEITGPWIDRVLGLVRADRLILGPPPPPPEPETYDDKLMEGFYAPPPRALPADLAVVSKKSGTPEELAAEILETKKRLSERSAQIFSEPKAEPVFEKPGFYRRPTNGAKPHSDEPPDDEPPLDMRRLPRENTEFQPIDFSRLAPPGQPAQEPATTPAPAPNGAYHRFEIVQEAEPVPVPEPIAPAPAVEPAVIPAAPEARLRQVPAAPEMPEPSTAPASHSRPVAPEPSPVAPEPTPVVPEPAPVAPETAPVAYEPAPVASEPAPAPPTPPAQPPAPAAPALPRQPIRLRIAPAPGTPQNPRQDSAK